MPACRITENVFSVGVNDWDRKLFDELIPLPDGTSYNAYFIKGDNKTALVDTVDPSKTDELLRNLAMAKAEKIDYIIASHAEQDHSGSLPAVLKEYPEAKIATNPKCKSFLKSLLHIADEKFIEIEEGERLDLGGKTLEFIYTPWVHWPETMSTYLEEDKILFSCDFFGSHRAASSLFVEDTYKTLEDAKRYYAEIMMPFRQMIAANIAKIEKKEISLIAPSHGPVYKKPQSIISAYKEWISEETEKKILIPYVSMHHSTKAMVDYLTSCLIEKNIKVIPFNLIGADIGALAMELVDAWGVIFASPYVLAGLHPAVIYAAYLTGILRPKLKFISLISSYGWGGRGDVQLKDLVKNLKAEFREPILIKGLPEEGDFNILRRFADELEEKINNI